MIRRLTSGAEAVVARLRVHRQEVVVGRAQPVAHAVEAREIRRRLGGLST
jgi:hypothetical protein